MRTVYSCTCFCFAQNYNTETEEFSLFLLHCVKFIVLQLLINKNPIFSCNSKQQVNCWVRNGSQNNRFQDFQIF